MKSLCSETCSEIWESPSNRFVESNVRLEMKFPSPKRGHEELAACLEQRADSFADNQPLTKCRRLERSRTTGLKEEEAELHIRKHVVDSMQFHERPSYPLPQLGQNGVEDCTSNALVPKSYDRCPEYRLWQPRRRQHDSWSAHLDPNLCHHYREFCRDQISVEEPDDMLCNLPNQHDLESAPRDAIMARFFTENRTSGSSVIIEELDENDMVTD